MPTATLLSEPTERNARNREKRVLLLKWLNQTTYSTADILGRVMDLNAHPPIYRMLHRLEGEGLIASGKVDLYGRNVSVWGITPTGLAIAQEECGAPQTERYFVASRVPPTMLVHYLGLQRLHLKALAAGWTDWTYPDFESGKYEANKYRPDAFTTAAGQRCAIEYERTIKTPKRYPEILCGHLKALKEGLAHRVIWVCDSDAVCARLQKIILSIEEVPTAKGRARVDPARHHPPLSFTTASLFPALPASTKGL